MIDEQPPTPPHPNPPLFLPRPFNVPVAPIATGALLRGHLLQPGVRAVRCVPAAGGDGKARGHLRGVERELGEVEVRATLEVRTVQLHGRLEDL